MERFPIPLRGFICFTFYAADRISVAPSRWIQVRFLAYEDVRNASHRNSFVL